MRKLLASLLVLATVAGASLSGLADGAPAAAKKKKACCKVVHTNGKAIATGSMRLPKGARLLHAGMDPAIGACTARGRGGSVLLRKVFDLAKTPRGTYRFVIAYRTSAGRMVTKASPGFRVRGKLPPADEA